MSKFLITKRSHNKVTGPIMVTTSPRRTCPQECPFRKTATSPTASLCYAEHGFLGGFLWSTLDKLPVGGSIKKGQIKIHSLEDLLSTVSQLPENTLWRHNQAGDLPTKDNLNIDNQELTELVAANDNRRGFTYTHFDVIKSQTNRKIVRDANKKGFTINLSANDVARADKLMDTKCAPVTVVLESGQTQNLETPNGHKVVICPAQTRRNVTCSSCALCAKQRDFIIGFPASGPKKQKYVANNDNNKKADPS